VDWQEVRAVLEAAYGLLDREDSTNPEAVCEAMGRPKDHEQTRRMLAYLHKSHHIGGFTIDGTAVPVTITATEKGLQEVRGWPSEAGGHAQVEQLLAILEQRIDDPETPDLERGRLRRVRQAVSEVAPRLMASIFVEYAERMGLAPPSGGD
jgi:hypothetical protein